MSSVYTNEDGLTVRFGQARSTVRLDGVKNAEDHRLVLKVADATDLTDADTAAATGEDVFIPAGAVIKSAYFVVTTTFTSGGVAVLDIGTKQLAGTTIDDDGIDAAVALAALTAGAVINCDGALISSAPTVDSYVTITFDTAAYTAGAGELVIEYDVL